jgi:hypothetical protein
MEYTRNITGRDLRKTPLVITGILVELLRTYFGSNEGDFRWSSDENSTQIIIEPAFEWNEEVSQKRPACYVKRGTLNYNRLVIDDLQNIRPIEGSITHAVQGMGSAVLMCIGELAGAAERIAEEVSEVMQVYSPVIRQEFNFLDFNVSAVGEVGISKEHSNMFNVPVGIQFRFSEAWNIICPRVKVQDILHELVVNVYETYKGALFGSGVYGDNEYGG